MTPTHSHMPVIWVLNRRPIKPGVRRCNFAQDPSGLVETLIVFVRTLVVRVGLQGREAYQGTLVTVQALFVLGGTLLIRVRVRGRNAS